MITNSAVCFVSQIELFPLLLNTAILEPGSCYVDAIFVDLNLGVQNRRVYKNRSQAAVNCKMPTWKRKKRMISEVWEPKPQLKAATLDNSNNWFGEGILPKYGKHPKTTIKFFSFFAQPH